ncbi:MAG: response regulator, partial [Proteobacteria bacterium]
IELLNDALEDRLREIRTEFRAITKDGASRWLLSHGDIIRNEQGKPVRLLGTFTDITNQKLADDAIHRSQKMDALGQMAGGVAHDFNNVLGVIIGNLNLILRDGSKDEKTLKRLGEIEKSTQRAVELTKKLLGFARQNPEHVAAVNLNTVIDDMRSLVERTVTPKIAVETDLSAQLWPSELDKDDFQDALLNLVLNARDAMPDGGCLRLTTSNARIEESINQTSSVVTPGDYVALKVSDTGTEIAPDDLDRIFEPFFTTKVQGKGTGLGLPMVYSFAKRYGGHIDVESQVDVGTSFALYFPRSERTPAASPADAKSRCILPAGHETVLVVDDELELGELARELLESLGYRVCLAQSGQEALEVIKNNAAIDLLFSDIIMPGGIDGFRLAEEAISHHPNLKILLSSGYAGYALEDNGGDPVSFEFLLKPYSDVELAQRVRKLLDGRDGIESSDVPTHERTRAAPVFQWSEELSTGIDPLDDDHRLLARLLHRSRRMIDDNEPVSTIGALLVEIRDLLVAHCRREEFVMKACGYPKFEEHTESHRFLIYRIDEMREQLDRRELPAKSVFLFLERYLTTHVSKNDLDYKAFCSGKQELVEDALLQAGSNLNPDGLSPDDATIPIR